MTVNNHQSRSKRRSGNSVHGDNRRAQLVSIATSLFATKGFSNTTVRDIADEAGILSGSLYHHFSSKEAILDEILREYLDDLCTRFAEIADSSDDPGLALDALIRHSFAVIAEIPHTVALYQNEATLLREFVGFEFVQDGGDQIEQIWVKTIASGQAAGTLRDDLDPKVAYRFIRDAVWSTVGWYRPGGRYEVESIISQYLGLLHRGITRS